MKRQIRIRFLVGICLFLALLGSGIVTYRIQFGAKAVRERAVLTLNRLLGAHVVVGDASFNPLLGVSLRDVTVSLDDTSGHPKVLARMSRVRLVHSLTRLLTGKLSIRSVSVRDGEVAVERLSDGRFSVEPVIEAIRRYFPNEDGFPAVDFDRVRVSYTDDVLVGKDGKPTSTELRNVMGSIAPTGPRSRTFLADFAVTDAEFGRWTVRGARFDGENGTAAFTAKSSPIALDENLKRRMNGKTLDVWERYRPRSGTVRLTANLRYDRRAEKPVDFDVLARFEQAAASYDSFPYEITDLSGTLIFRPTGVEVKGLAGRSGSVPVSVRGSAGYGPEDPVDLRIEAERLGLDAKLRAAFDASQRETWDEFHPEGFVDVVSVLSRDADPARKLRVRVLATNSPATRVHAVYSGFPYPLDLEGSAFYDGGAVAFVKKPVSTRTLERLVPGVVVARHGDVVMELDGGTEPACPNRLVNLTCRLRPSGRLPLDADLKQALPGAIREAWDYLNLAGSVRATCLIQRTDPEQPALDLAVVLTDLKTRIRCRDFPYEILDPAGSVTYERTAAQFPLGRLVVHDLKTASDNATVSIVGEISGFRSSEPVEKMDLTIKGRDVALDRRLRLATPARYATLWENLSPTEDSLVNVECRLERTHRGQARADFSLDIDSIDSSLECADFPYRVEHLRGLAEYRSNEQTPDGMLRLVDLRCSARPAGIGLAGTLSGFAPEKGIDRVELVIDGQMVPLDAKLRACLPEKHRKTFDAFHPEGHADVACTLKRTSRDEALSAEICITPLGSSMCYEGFPLRLSDVSGSITIAGGEVTVRGLHARAAGGVVTLDGVVHQNGRRGVDFAVKAEGLVVGEELASALPKKSRDLWQELSPAGVVTLSGVVHSADNGTGGVVEYSGALLPKDLSLRLGLGFEHLSGAIRVEGKVSEGKHDFQGRAEFAAASIGGNTVRELRGRFEKHDNLFSVYELTGKAYGGDVSGQLRMKLDEPVTYGMVADANALRLGELLRKAFDIGDDRLEGRLSGRVMLQGRGADARSLVGQADLKVHEGRLWEVPFVLRLLNVLQLSVPERSSFSDADVRLRFYDRHIDVTRLALLGRTSAIYGEGTLESGGAVNLSFSTDFGWLRFLELPVITPVVRTIQKQLFLVKMTGSLSDPKVEVVPIPPVTGTVKGLVDTLLGARKASKEPK
jgi:hypothetical protein